jgi:hypothetical protein
MAFRLPIIKGAELLDITVTPSLTTVTQNVETITFTEGGDDLELVSRRVYVFDTQGFSSQANPSILFQNSGNKKVWVYFYSDEEELLGYVEIDITVNSSPGYIGDSIADCDYCFGLTRESTLYTGPLIKLFRTSDWKVADIGQDSFQKLNMSEVDAFEALPVDNILSGLPLDGLSATTSTGYSVHRKIRTGYVGNCLRLRRSTDNVEQDFGFDSNGDLDVSSINTFLGGATGFVPVLYNQGTLGSASDLIQATLINQPRLDLTTNLRPTIDISNNGSNISLMRARTPLTVSGAYPNLSTFNTFFTLKGKNPQTNSFPIPLFWGDSTYTAITPGAPGISYFNNILFTSAGSSIGKSNDNFYDWNIFCQRTRLSTPLGDRRYNAMSINERDITSGGAISNWRTTNITTSITNLGLNWGSIANTFQGWFSEWIVDATNLSLNDFYKIKYNLASQWSITSVTSPPNELRVMKLYNQKSVNENHWYQNTVSNMPNFIKSSSFSGQPAIYAFQNGISGTTTELRNSLMWADVATDVEYDSIYTNVDVSVAFDGTFRCVLGSLTRSYYYYNSLNSMIYYNNSIRDFSSLGYTNTEGQKLKVSALRVYTPNGNRSLSRGTQTSTVTSSINTAIGPYSGVFARVGNSIVWEGWLFSFASFRSIPDPTDWTNTIYPQYRDKYSAVN